MPASWCPSAPPAPTAADNNNRITTENNNKNNKITTENNNKNNNSNNNNNNKNKNNANNNNNKDHKNNNNTTDSETDPVQTPYWFSCTPRTGGMGIWGCAPRSHHAPPAPSTRAPRGRLLSSVMAGQSAVNNEYSTVQRGRGPGHNRGPPPWPPPWPRRGTKWREFVASMDRYENMKVPLPV